MYIIADKQQEVNTLNGAGLNHRIHVHEDHIKGQVLTHGCL